MAVVFSGRVSVTLVIQSPDMPCLHQPAHRVWGYLVWPAGNALQEGELFSTGRRLELTGAHERHPSLAAGLSQGSVSQSGISQSVRVRDRLSTRLSDLSTLWFWGCAWETKIYKESQDTREREPQNRRLDLSGAGEMADPISFEDMESFLRVAKYTLVKYTDMHAEMREEAMDTCITAVEKYPNDSEKCTQVRFGSSAVCPPQHKYN